jgi:hypothetical protein
MGQMHQHCQEFQSTQPSPSNTTTKPVQVLEIFDDPMEDVPQEPHNSRTHFVFMAIYKINGNLFTNQTGHFTITSNHGHAYVVIFYIYNANAICSIPIKNHSKEELLHAYGKINAWLTFCGFKPLLHKLNNKTSTEVETFIATKQTCIQYTPLDMSYAPGNNVSLVGMAGLPKSFPIANWCRLTPQCNATLNMLHPCCQNPLLLAHKVHKGLFSFDACPHGTPWHRSLSPH